MRRSLPTLLSLLILLLAGCGAPAETVSQQPELPAAQVLSAMVAACPEGTEEGLELLSDSDLPIYLSASYGLDDGQWADAAVARLGGASAFELAVLRLPQEAGQTDIDRAVEGLSAHLVAREGDFTGYAPEQAALVQRGQVLTQGRYLALVICEDTQAPTAAFTAALNGETALLPAPLPEPEPEDSTLVTPLPDLVEIDPATSEEPQNSEELPASEEPSPTPTESPAVTQAPVTTPALPESQPPTPSPADGRTPYVDPHTDDMTLYDTSAILAAWRGGDRAALSSRDSAILTAAEEVLAQETDEGMSDYQKELALYRWLVSQVDYDWAHNDPLDTADPDSSNPYGALVGRKAICVGYATAFQLLMDMCDVQCITVVGAAYNSQDNHAWNMVRLGGQWYCVDATWDLYSGGQLPASWSFRYFNVTSEWMALTDHQWDYDNVPEATATDGGVG